MVQAARSGARNIPEGSEASGTSKKTELKLTNVSKASLEELLLDLEAFLRQHRLRIWSKDSPEAMAVRNKYKSDGADRADASEKAPACPKCGKPMRRRTARQGARAGQAFWGCSGYPDCRGIVPISAKMSDRSDTSDTSDTSDQSDQSDQSDNPYPCPPPSMASGTRISAVGGAVRGNHLESPSR